MAHAVPESFLADPGIRSCRVMLRAARLLALAFVLANPVDAASRPASTRGAVPPPVNATSFALARVALPHGALADLARLGSPDVASAACGNGARNCRIAAAARPALPAGLPDLIFAAGFDYVGQVCVVSGDCPPSGAECVQSACSLGQCANQSSTAGLACSGGVCDGSGSCVGCNASADCPPSGSDCLDVACISHQCVQQPLGIGTACAGGVCNDIGMCVECLANADCPTSECHAALCDTGVCGSNLLPLGSACTGGVCDAVGSCVQCLTANDCPAGASECSFAVCTAGICGTTNAAAGTACTGGVCDGSGICVQ